MTISVLFIRQTNIGQKTFQFRQKFLDPFLLFSTCSEKRGQVSWNLLFPFKDNTSCYFHESDLEMLFMDIPFMTALQNSGNLILLQLTSINQPIDVLGDDEENPSQLRGDPQALSSTAWCSSTWSGSTRLGVTLIDLAWRCSTWNGIARPGVALIVLPDTSQQVSGNLTSWRPVELVSLSCPFSGGHGHI